MLVPNRTQKAVTRFFVRNNKCPKCGNELQVYKRKKEFWELMDKDCVPQSYYKRKSILDGDKYVGLYCSKCNTLIITSKEELY